MRSLGITALLLVSGTTMTHAGQEGAALLKKAKAVLAQLEGDIHLPGLKEPVEVLRDRWGVPHIYAKNADDLFFAQGFVAAQDRLFQLELWRRLAAGESAEIYGPDAVEADRFARLIRYRGDLDAEWASYSPDTKQIATAFTRGINACIDHLGDKLPIEFQVLGLKPKKWHAEDILGRMSGIIMSRNFQQEVQRAQIVQAVGIDKARWLAPANPAIAWGAGRDTAGIDARILAGYEAATKLLKFAPAQTESNNWVVSGKRSASGAPLLASDPHRAIAVPALRYLVHLHAPGWHVIGAGEPALPGIALGHNERIAWGITIVCTDQADIFVEETNPANPAEYKVGKRWQPMKIERETIRVKGKRDQTLELRFTRHGPVLFQDDKLHRAYALKWAGSEPGGAAYLGALAVSRAHDQQSFREALKAWKIPGLNFVYADKDGNIGWVAAALTPVRKDHDGLLPVPGNGGFEWQRYLDVAELPQSFNPKQGWLGTANHNILPKGYKHVIAFDWAPPYRFQRVKANLEANTQFDLKDFQRIQHDTVSLPGLALQRALKQVKLKDKDLEPYVRMFLEWDGNLSRAAMAGPLYAVWLDELQHALFSPQVPESLVPALRSLSGVSVLLDVLEQPTEKWLGKNPAAARDELVRSTFLLAVVRLKRQMPDVAEWRWGKLHTVTFDHPLAGLGPNFAKAFSFAPLERPGDANTPNNARYDDGYKQIHGPTYRQLFDLADWDHGLATSAPGQSGQPGSPHYGDLLPMWAEGQYFPLAFSRAKVNEVAEHRLVLRPAAK